MRYWQTWLWHRAAGCLAVKDSALDAVSAETIAVLVIQAPWRVFVSCLSIFLIETFDIFVYIYSRILYRLLTTLNVVSIHVHYDFTSAYKATFHMN